MFYSDHLGKRRNIPGFSDKGATKSLERMIEKLVSHRVSNKPFDQKLMSWIESLAPRFIKKFISIGLIDSHTSAVIKPLMIAKKIKRKHSGKNIVVFNVESGHLADYRNNLEAEERTKDHIRESINHIARLFDSQNVLYTTDITFSRIQKYLAEFRATGVSAARVNAAISAIKAFCNWMVKEERMITNPANRVKKLNIKIDRRYKRSVLTQIEIDRLFEVLPNTESHNGLDYQSRGIIYKLALKAGLRWNEIYTLMRSDFGLDTEPATVTIRAQNEKARRGATLPLESSLADDLRNYFSANSSAQNSKAIKGMWKKRGAEMLRKDLMTARINPKRESGKVIDFHGLRHTYGTALAQAGVMPAHLKSLMRHSNVQLTMEYYTHLSIDDLNEEIAKISLPKSIDAEKSTIPEKVTTQPVKEPKEVENDESVNICVTQCVTNNGKLTSFSRYG